MAGEKCIGPSIKVDPNFSMIQQQRWQVLATLCASVNLSYKVNAISIGVELDLRRWSQLSASLFEHNESANRRLLSRMNDQVMKRQKLN